MVRIAKKPRTVKGKKGKKPAQTVEKRVTQKPSPPRYTLKKDSLGRRYAIDKRTGRRVSVSKAEKERVQRKKAAAKQRELFRGITPTKGKVSKKRSKAAKKGWETRRKRALQPDIQQLRRLMGDYAFPEGMRIFIPNGIADRSSVYPKVKERADYAFDVLMADHYIRRRARNEGKPIPPATPTPRFDRLYGPGIGQLIRDRLAGAMDLADIDQLIEELANDPDYDFSTRELYTLYFSPEVA
jgi:hypothetical protein